MWFRTSAAFNRVRIELILLSLSLLFIRENPNKCSKLIIFPLEKIAQRKNISCKRKHTLCMDGNLSVVTYFELLFSSHKYYCRMK